MQRLVPLQLQTFDHIEHAYRQLYLMRDKAQGDLEIDCTYVQFVRPNGLLALVTMARLWHQWTQARTMLTNVGPIHAYLERIDLFHTCGEWIGSKESLATSAHYLRSPSSQTLLELQKIAGDNEQLAMSVDHAAQRTQHILSCWYPSHQEVIPRLCAMLSELTSNITHSRDQGFAAIQRYDGSYRVGGKSIIVMAIADLGIGIQQSLTEKGQHPPQQTESSLLSSDYIRHALQIGITSGEGTRGIGLSHVQRLVTNWNGDLSIRSGQSEVMLGSNRETVRNDLLDIPGVHVTITLRDPSEHYISS